MHPNVTTTKSTHGDNHTETTREATILQYISLVDILARRLQSRLPSCVTLDDLVGAGTIGLIQAVDRFDRGRGHQFATFARHRIWGAMLDFLRTEDPLSRNERLRVRAAELDTATPPALPVTISLELLNAQDELYVASQYTRSPENGLFDSAVMHNARQCLSRRENRVISLLFDLDRTNLDVARELGVNESRISQIKHVVLSKLRARLQGHMSGVPA